MPARERERELAVNLRHKQTKLKNIYFSNYDSECKKWRDDLFGRSHLHKLERTTRSMFLNLKSLNEWRDRMLDFVYAERTSLSLRQKSMSTWWKCRHICYYEDPWTYLISSKAFRAFFSSSFMVSRSLTRAYMRGCLRTRKMMSSTWERKKWDF